MIKINHKILSIPPHISTTWNCVIALRMMEDVLEITLIDGDTVAVPGLEPAAIEAIFRIHASILEEQTKNTETSPSFPLAQLKLPTPINQIISGFNQENRVELPIRFAIGSVDDFGMAFQHNPAQADYPEIPKEILEKIVAVTKMIVPEEALIFPKPEPSCNCVHCQIGRAALPEGQSSEEKEAVANLKEEFISDADLSFQTWDIQQAGEQLFTVLNRLDPKESYQVFLGSPIGCTCGKEGCEHIIAVLKS